MCIEGSARTAQPAIFRTRRRGVTPTVSVHVVARPRTQGTVRMQVNGATSASITTTNFRTLPIQGAFRQANRRAPHGNRRTESHTRKLDSPCKYTPVQDHHLPGCRLNSSFLRELVRAFWIRVHPRRPKRSTRCSLTHNFRLRAALHSWPLPTRLVTATPRRSTLGRDKKTCFRTLSNAMASLAL